MANHGLTIANRNDGETGLIIDPTSKAARVQLPDSLKLRGVYSYTAIDVAGAAAAKAYVSLFNYPFNGVYAQLLRAEVSGYAVAQTIVKGSLEAQIFHFISGIDPVNGLTICRHRSSYPLPACGIFLAGGSYVLPISGAYLRSFSPPVVTEAVATSAYAPFESSVESAADYSDFLLGPSMGYVISNPAAADVDQVWNVRVCWAEYLMS